MQRLLNKHILVGVTGSIAAYKSAELVRRLRTSGAQVRVVMSRSATEFVTAMTFQALSGNPVRTALMDVDAEAAMGHIELARWADAIIVAPTTANFIARLATGSNDDLLTSVCLASTCPLAIAPAMNQNMWADAATQENVETLMQRQICVFGPGEGGQACGDTGLGRMQEPDQLVQDVADLFETGHLTGKTVLVTAGPTEEAIDPVRFISNRSSGKMGFAVAEAVVDAGARCILIAGPVHLTAPDKVERIDVGSAQEMLAAVQETISQCDIFIAAAAVSDYRIKQVATHKMKKSDNPLTLELIPTTDILAEVSKQSKHVFTVGFAAETENLLENAEKKRVVKGLDMIVANDVSDGDIGFDRDENAVTILWQDGIHEIAKARKLTVAFELIKIVSEQFDESHQLIVVN